MMPQNTRPKVLLIGNYFAVTGYAQSTRSTFDNLKLTNADVKIYPVDWHTHKFDYEKDKTNVVFELPSINNQYDLIIISLSPDQGYHFLKLVKPFAKKTCLSTALIEADRMLPQWLRILNEFDMIHLISNFLLEPIKNCQHPNKELKEKVLAKCFVIHNTLDPEMLKKPEQESEIKEPFYLISGDCSTNANPIGERKQIVNTTLALAAILERIPNAPSIVIKTTKIYPEFINELKNYDVPIYMTEEEPNQLYHNPNCVGIVSLTRAEGWGMTMFEAWAMNIPVIATNWSAHLEFLKDYEQFYPVDFHLDNAKFAMDCYAKDSKWAIAHPESLNEQITLHLEQLNKIKAKRLSFLRSKQLPKHAMKFVHTRDMGWCNIIKQIELKCSANATE